MLIYAYPMSIPPQPVLVLLGHPWAFAPCLRMELLWSSGVLNRAFWQGLHSELVMGLFDHSKAQFSFKKKQLNKQLNFKQFLKVLWLCVVLKVLLAWSNFS